MECKPSFSKCFRYAEVLICVFSLYLFLLNVNPSCLSILCSRMCFYCMDKCASLADAESLIQEHTSVQNPLCNYHA